MKNGQRVCNLSEMLKKQRISEASCINDKEVLVPNVEGL